MRSPEASSAIRGTVIIHGRIDIVIKIRLNKLVESLLRMNLTAPDCKDSGMMSPGMISMWLMSFKLLPFKHLPFKDLCKHDLFMFNDLSTFTEVE